MRACVRVCVCVCVCVCVFVWICPPPKFLEIPWVVKFQNWAPIDIIVLTVKFLWKNQIIVIHSPEVIQLFSFAFFVMDLWWKHPKPKPFDGSKKFQFPTKLWQSGVHVVGVTWKRWKGGKKCYQGNMSKIQLALSMLRGSKIMKSEKLVDEVKFVYKFTKWRRSKIFQFTYKRGRKKFLALRGEFKILAYNFEFDHPPTAGL